MESSHSSGLNDIYFGVPAQLGRLGVERIVEYTLSEKEKTALKRSAQGVSKNIAKLNLKS